jgi:2-C-methyl-D-erythritol 4-phosphate cytidylyltransferase
MENVALIVAAGRGVRFGGDVPKQFRPINGRPLLSWTVAAFENTSIITDIVLVVPQEFLLFANEQVVEPFGFQKVRKIVVGGETRRDSVCRGLKSLPISTRFVAIHDGARPVVASEDIARVMNEAMNNRAAILARAATDTVKRAEGGFILATLERSKIYLAETPQAFQYDLIMSAFEQAGGSDNVTDDAALVEKLGFKIKIVEPHYLNIKVTEEIDLILARRLLDDR